MGETITSTTTTSSTDESRRRGTDLASLGFAMAAAGPLLLLAAVVLWGLDTDDLAFFVVPIVAGIVGAVLIRRRSTAARVVAVLLAVVIALMLFWTAFGLAAPASFFDFVPGILVLPGALLALVAGVVSMRSRSAIGEGERRAIGGIGAVLGLLALGSAVLTLTGKDTLSEVERESADAEVTLSDFEFDAEGYDLAPGDTVLVRNDDPVLHTFTIDALDIDVTMNPGSEKLVTLPDEPGTYVLYCAPHTSDEDEPSEDDMAAQLTIG